MNSESDAMRHVRATLCGHIDGIAAAVGRQSAARLCENVDLVRSLAQAHGLIPVAQLARTLETMIAHGDRGAMVRGTIDLMRDAAGCDRIDASASEAFAAAMSVRLAG